MLGDSCAEQVICNSKCKTLLQAGFIIYLIFILLAQRYSFAEILHVHVWDKLSWLTSHHHLSLVKFE